MVIVVLEQPRFQILLEVEEAFQALEEGVAFLEALGVEAEVGAYRGHRVMEVVEGASQLPAQVEVEVGAVPSCLAWVVVLVEGACLHGQAEVGVVVVEEEEACLLGQAEVEVVVAEACLLGRAQGEVCGAMRLVLKGHSGH